MELPTTQSAADCSLPARTGPKYSRSGSKANRTKGSFIRKVESKRLSKCLLCLVVFVAVAFVESVGALANHVGTHGDADALLFARPILGGLEQTRPGAFASLPFVDDQAVNFSALRHFEQAGNADVQPANHFALKCLRHKHRVIGRRS